MVNVHPEKEGFPPAFLVDPASLHILLVDASSSSRQHLASLLRECSYQVTACKTSQEAVQILKAQQGPEGTAGFDLILKEHCPQAGTNACRLLRRAQVESVLQGIPIIVASTTEDRDVMVSCLQLGAADYMLKPLRHSELRNLWARVYWWRRASYLQQQPAGSVSLPAPVSQGSVGSDNTKCCSDDDEAQPGMICEIRSGEGSAPNDGSNGNGSGENGSKTGGLSSRNQATKAEAHNSGDAEVDAKSNSANKAEQGSNHPSKDTGQAPNAKFGNGNSGVGHTTDPQEPTPAGTEAGVIAPNANVLLEIAPLQVEASVPTTQSKDATPAAVAPSGAPQLAGQISLTATATRPMVAASGFRAYIAKDTSRKRSLELAQKEEDVGGNSSGSDRTASIELHGGGKRRQVAELGGPPVSQGAASGTMSQQPGMLTSAPPKAGTFEELPSGSGSWSPLQAGQQLGNGFNPYYPFGVMPSPFSVQPQFWGQLPGSGSCSEADLASLFSYQQQSQSLGSSSRDREVQQGLQQQQLAMHNQLMYQHTILMQQYGMPAPPFPPFANYGGGPAQQQQQQQQQDGQVQQQPISLTGRLSGQTSGALSPPAGAAPQKGSSDKRTAAKGTWTGATTAREQSYPASGAATGAATATATGTGTGTATGNTLGANGHSNAVTSHTTVQVGPDGCMVEPSRKERRAQALHKYKQKRKTLCFTKKIRYESRKQLAQARPRVKGQFVRVRSEDVDEAVNALTSVQKDCASPGDAVVPQVAIERAGGNADTVAGLMAAAKKLFGDTDVSEEEDFEETFEDDDDDDDDVNSPAHQIHRATAKPAVPTTATLPSSDSGSNSPEPNAIAVNVQG